MTKIQGRLQGVGFKTSSALSLSLSATHFLLVISLSPRIYPGFTSISTSIYSHTSFSSSVWIVRIFAFKNNPPRGKTFSSNTCQRSLYGEDRDIRKNKPFFFFWNGSSVLRSCYTAPLYCRFSSTVKASGSLPFPEHLSLTLISPHVIVGKSRRVE